LAACAVAWMGRNSGDQDLVRGVTQGWATAVPADGVGAKMGSGQAQHRGEGDLVGVDAQGHRRGHGEVAQGVVDNQQSPDLLSGQFRGLSTQDHTRATQGDLDPVVRARR